MRVAPGVPSFYLNEIQDINEAEILFGRNMWCKVVSYEVRDGVDYFVIEVSPK